MNFNLTVSFLDGTSCEVSGTAADLVAFEAEFDISVTRLNADTKITHLLWLAWHSLKRQGQTKDVFDKWVEGVDTIDSGSPKK